MESQPGTTVLNGEGAFRLLAWKKRNMLNLDLHLFLKLAVLLGGADVCCPRRETEVHHVSTGNGQKKTFSLSMSAPRKSKGNIIKSS